MGQGTAPKIDPLLTTGRGITHGAFLGLASMFGVYLSGLVNWARPNKATDERTTVVRTNKLALFLLIGGNVVISLKYGIPKFLPETLLLLLLGIDYYYHISVCIQKNRS
jgi:hypothetical protein